MYTYTIYYICICFQTIIEKFKSIAFAISHDNFGKAIVLHKLLVKWILKHNMWKEHGGWVEKMGELLRLGERYLMRAGKYM